MKVKNGKNKYQVKSNKKVLVLKKKLNIFILKTL